MELLGLRSLIYSTTDITVDTEWWSKTLGKKPYFVADAYVGFNMGGYEIGLFVAPQPFPDGGITYVGVPDTKAAYVELTEKHDCTGYEEPVEVGGGITMASVARANGQILGIITNPHFKIESKT